MDSRLKSAGRTEGAGRESAAPAAVASLLPPRFTLSLPGPGFLPARRFAGRAARVCASDLAVLTLVFHGHDGLRGRGND